MKLGKMLESAEVREDAVLHTVVQKGFSDEGTLQQKTWRNKLCRSLRNSKLKALRQVWAWNSQGIAKCEESREASSQREPGLRKPCGPFLGWMTWGLIEGVRAEEQIKNKVLYFKIPILTASWGLIGRGKSRRIREIS